MKRFTSVLLCFVFIIIMLAGCNSKPADLRILSVQNSASAAITHIFDRSNNKVNYLSSTVNLPNRVRNLIADGECDIAVVPLETALLIHHRGLSDIKILAGISTGGFELVTTENITDFSALNGKTVYLTERGTVMESVFRYLLSQFDIDPFEGISFDYVSDAKQLEKQLTNNEISYALLNSAEAASVKKAAPNLVSLNVTDGLSQKLKNPSIITYCVIGTTDFITKNPKIIETFLSDIKASIDKSSDLSATVISAKKAGLITDDIYGTDFISAYKPNFISGKAMKEKLSAYFKLILKVNPSLIGNKAPSDDFYYLKEK